MTNNNPFAIKDYRVVPVKHREGGLSSPCWTEEADGWTLYARHMDGTETAVCNLQTEVEAEALRQHVLALESAKEAMRETLVTRLTESGKCGWEEANTALERSFWGFHQTIGDFARDHLAVKWLTKDAPEGFWHSQDWDAVFDWYEEGEDFMMVDLAEECTAFFAAPNKTGRD